MSGIDRCCGEKQNQGDNISGPGPSQELLPTSSTIAPVNVSAWASPPHTPAGIRPLGAQRPYVIQLRTPPKSHRHRHTDTHTPTPPSGVLYTSLSQ